jgi:hypothetical protein
MILVNVWDIGNMEENFNKTIYISNFISVCSYIFLGISKIFKIDFLLYLSILGFILGLGFAIKSFKILKSLRIENYSFYKSKIFMNLFMIISPILFIYICLMFLKIKI